MKFFLFTLIFLNSLLFATVYEDAADENINGWSVYDSSPAGATISNIYDEGNSVIKLSGEGINNGFMLGDWSGGANVWNNRREKTITWGMKYDENFIVYISVETIKGHRYLYYTNSNQSWQWRKGKYLHHGLGLSASDGRWRTFSRDLESDLKDLESDNSIVSVNAFLIRGSGMIDDIVLLEKRIYEDAEDSNTKGWMVYDNSPSGATISNIEDNGNRVIQLQGDGTDNGYILGNWSEESKAWNNSSEKVIKWSMKYNEDFRVYISVETEKGHRFLEYSNKRNDSSSEWSNDAYIHHGIGENASDGTWRTYTRDLEADLKDLESDNSIIFVNALLIRGSGLVDDIEMSNQSIILNRVAAYKFSPQDKVDYITLSKDGTKAYVTGKDLIVLDISDSNNIKEIGRYSGIRGKVEVSQDGTKAYIMKNGLTILDISNVNNIVVLSNLSTFKSGLYNENDIPFNPNDIELSADGTKIYMSNYDEWYFDFAVIDVSNSANPIKIGQYAGAMEGQAIALSPDGTKVFNLFNGLDLVDVTNPTSPMLLDTYPGGSGNDLVFSKDGTKAYLFRGLGRGLDVLDLTNPSNIERISSFNIVGTAGLNKITLSKDEKVAYLSGGGHIFRLIDISDSSNLFEIVNYSEKGTSSASISEDDTKAYLINIRKNELIVLDIAK